MVEGEFWRFKRGDTFFNEFPEDSRCGNAELGSDRGSDIKTGGADSAGGVDKDGGVLLCFSRLAEV